MNGFCLHRYFHVDCWNTLTHGHVIELDTNGLSRFGNVYAGPLAQMPREALNREQRRERDLEVIRKRDFPHRHSRLQSFFAAPTLEEAKRHALRMNNAKDAEARIFEVFAGSNYDALDVMWLDIVGIDDAQMQHRYTQYWLGMKSSDVFFDATSPRPPLLEVLLPLPLRLGEVVTTVKRDGYV